MAASLQHQLDVAVASCSVSAAPREDGAVQQVGYASLPLARAVPHRMAFACTEVDVTMNRRRSIQAFAVAAAVLLSGCASSIKVVQDSDPEVAQPGMGEQSPFVANLTEWVLSDVVDSLLEIPLPIRFAPPHDRM